MTLGLLALLLTAATPTQTVTRLFVQDLADGQVKWADVTATPAGELTLGPVQPVPGVKPIDPKTQSLVQMRSASGLVCVGVRDTNNGQTESGFFVFKTGVASDDHGDHAHHDYADAPKLVTATLDTKQGNPAHVYDYQGKFYLANDKLNGVTEVDPQGLLKGSAGAVRFVRAGGGHITLAVVNQRVCYATWIDAQGENQGRVDVASLADAKSYRLKLPTGGLHGAATASDKVFFAPAKDIHWVRADEAVSQDPTTVKIETISLGTEGDQPRRTGAFTTHGTRVYCVTGKAEPQLVVIDAEGDAPKARFIPLAKVANARPVTPEVVTTESCQTVALVCHDRLPGTDGQDTLEAITLTAAGTMSKLIPLGQSAVSGHFGHHATAADAAGRYAFVTNSGDGTITAVDLRTLTVKATFKPGGKPGALLAAGGPAEAD